MYTQCKTFFGLRQATAVHPTRIVNSISIYSRFMPKFHGSSFLVTSLEHMLIGWGKGGNVTAAGWQVTLCDPIWHVSSRSGAALVAWTAIRFFTFLWGSRQHVTRNLTTSGGLGYERVTRKLLSWNFACTELTVWPTHRQVPGPSNTVPRLVLLLTPEREDRARKRKAFVWRHLLNRIKTFST